MPDINVVTQITDWNVGDILAGSAPGRSARIPGSTSADLKVLAQQGNGKNSAKPFWTSVGSIIPGLAAIATSGSANDLVSGTIPPLRFPALTGDVTTPGGSLATTISPNAVSNGKLAKMPPMTLKGNNSILSADPKDLTVAEVNAMGIGGGGGGSGTVTSVGLSLPAIFSVAGSPITTAGTFTVTLATEAANAVWAGPSAGAPATPTFRGLVAADIPSLSSIYQPLDATLTALSALADAVGFLHNDGAGNLAWSAAGSGTVTSVSVVSANGLAGTVATATTTPAIMLSTTITGLLKGNATAISAASVGTDYVAPGAVTGSGLTQATARILGRTTAGTGAIEEITVGGGLTLSAGALTATGGTGDFVGPASATDNAAVRFDGTTGKLGQNSLVTIDDNGNVLIPSNESATVVRALQVFAASSSYAQYNVGKDSTHYLTAEWDSVANNGNFSTYNLDYPLRMRGSVFQVSTSSSGGGGETTALTVSNAQLLRLHAYGAGFLQTDASGNVTAGAVSSTPAGSNTQIQYNNSGAFGASNQLTYDSANGYLAVGANGLTPLFPSSTRAFFAGPANDVTLEWSSNFGTVNSGLADWQFINRAVSSGTTRVAIFQVLTGVSDANTGQIVMAVKKNAGDANPTTFFNLFNDGTLRFGGYGAGWLQTDGSGNVSTGTPPSGIGGTTGSTDNAALRADGAGGSTAQSSGVIIDDNSTVTIPSRLQVTGSGIPVSRGGLEWSYDPTGNGGTGWGGLELYAPGTVNLRPIIFSVNEFYVGTGASSGFSTTRALTIDVNQKAVFSSTIKTGTPSGGTSSEWKLGSKVTTGVTLDTNGYIELDVGGTLYKLALVT